MILTGYSEAGKTALTNRLLGNKIQVDERNSTEGIALHRIEFTFNTREMKGGKWNEKYIKASDLIGLFSHSVWSRTQKRGSDGFSEKSITDEKEKTYVYHTEEDRVNIDEESLPSSSPSDIEAEQSLKIQTIEDETKKELFDNENVTIKQDSEDETHFTISVWDLGGQDEFISTHHLFLNTEATTLIVMDNH